MLKAAVKEGDKNREVLARQMTHAMKQEMQMMTYSPEFEDRREKPVHLGSPYAPLGAQNEPIDDSYGQEKKVIRPTAIHSKERQRNTSAGRQESSVDKALSAKVDAIFAQYDKNGDGKIKVGRLPKDLRDIDQDGDGYISKKEMFDKLKSL